MRSQETAFDQVFLFVIVIIVSVRDTYRGFVSGHENKSVSGSIPGHGIRQTILRDGSGCLMDLEQISMARLSLFSMRFYVCILSLQSLFFCCLFFLLQV